MSNLDNLKHENGSASGLLVSCADNACHPAMRAFTKMEAERVVSWIMIITENDFPGMKHFALGLNGRATLSNIDVHSGEYPRKFHNLFGHPNSTVTRAFVGGHVKGGRRAMMQRLGSQGGIWFRESDISVGKCRPDFDRVSGLNDYAQTHDGLGVACIALTLGALRLTCERGSRLNTRVCVENFRFTF